MISNGRLSIFILSSFIILIVPLSNCSVIPDDARNKPKSPPNLGGPNEPVILVDDKVHLTQPSWFMHFLKNFSDYLIILMPLLIIVLLIKYNKFVPSSVKQTKFIKLLVYGIPNNESISSIEDGLPLIQSDLDNKSKPERIQEKNKSFLHLLFCFFGLQISFLTWGILQEKIMTQKYVLKNSFIESHLNQLSEDLISIESTKDSLDPSIVFIKFRNAQFLVLINRVLAFTLAVIVLIYRQKFSSSSTSSQISFFQMKQPPFYKYIFCSLSNIMSSWCQYEALKYVSFPAQVLSKGCKMIPTMLMNQVMMGKNQRRSEWIFALAISFGMTIFLLNEQRESSHLDHDSSSNVTFWSGLVILALYLTFDSFTSNWQQSLFDEYRTLTSIHMMAAVNFYSILFTLISLIQQKDFFPAISLLFANPILLRDCIILSICSAAGQLFIFHTISTFGAIVFSLIMTLRQAFAILLSCLIYSHSITWFGILGIFIIFASLFFKTYRKFQEKRTKTPNIKLTKMVQNVI